MLHSSVLAPLNDLVNIDCKLLRGDVVGPTGQQWVGVAGGGDINRKDRCDAADNAVDTVAVVCRVGRSSQVPGLATVSAGSRYQPSVSGAIHPDTSFVSVSLVTRNSTAMMWRTPPPHPLSSPPWLDAQRPPPPPPALN